MVVIMLTLAPWFWARIQQGILSKYRTGINLAGGKFDPKREVNSLLSRTIKEVFMAYRSHADNTETGGDDDAIKR
jgi:hypothetical protein